MNALEALENLRNKKYIERTEAEKLIVLMWEENNGYESMAMKAAEELADMRAVLQAARVLVVQMRAVYDDPQYRAVWELAYQRYGNYTGTNWIEEFFALEAALKTGEGVKQ